LGNASWLALGCVLAFAGNEVVMFTRSASFAGAGAAGAGFSGVSALTWIVTLATPFVAVATAVRWLHRRSPLPDELVGGGGFVLALVAACVVPILGPLLWRPLAVRGVESCATGVILEGYRTMTQARVISTSMFVVLVGGWILRVRGAERSAR